MSLQKISDVATVHFTEEHGNEAFDPSIIMVIFEVIQNFIQAFQQCRQTPSQAKKISASPNWMHTYLLKSRVRRAMGWQAYMKHGREVVNALLKTGKDVSVEDIAEAYEEV